jgi:glucose uptake protein GlcU
MKINKQVKQFGLLVLLIIGVVIARYVKNTRQENLLENSKQTIAIFHESNFVYRTGYISHFKYEVKGKKYHLDQPMKITTLEKGDTVLIEYSIKDPSVAKVVDLYYMEKYKHLRDSVD